MFLSSRIGDLVPGSCKRVFSPTKVTRSSMLSERDCPSVSPPSRKVNRLTLYVSEFPLFPVPYKPFTSLLLIRTQSYLVLLLPPPGPTFPRGSGTEEGKGSTEGKGEGVGRYGRSGRVGCNGQWRTVPGRVRFQIQVIMNKVLLKNLKCSRSWCRQNEWQHKVRRSYHEPYLIHE